MIDDSGKTLIEKVDAIDDGGYHTTHTPLISKTQEDYISNHIQLLLKGVEYLDCPSVSVMSVGAGHGYYEKQLATEVEFNIDYILAVEPNKCFEGELRENLNSTGSKFRIDLCKFDENYESNESFDLIIFQHSLYYMKNPVASLKRAKKLLKEGGKIVVLIAGEQGISRQISLTLNKHLKDSSKLPHLFGAPELINGLEACSIQHEVIEEQITLVDNDDFISGRDKKLFPSFLTQIEYETLPANVQESLYDRIKAMSFVDESSGRYKCTSCTVLITIPWN